MAIILPLRQALRSMLKVSPLKYYFRKLVKKYFVKLDPVLNSYYEMAAPINFAGDFEIEAEFSTTSSSHQSIITIGGFLVRVYNNGIYIYGNVNYSLALYQNSNLTDGKLHKIKITGTQGQADIIVIIDGVLATSSDTPIAVSTLSGLYTIGSYNATTYFKGIIANVKLTDKSGASDVVTTFKLDNSPASEKYIYSTEILNNNTFTDNANARQYLIATKGWIIADGGAAP